MPCTRRAVHTLKLIVSSPSDHNRTVKLPYAVAWAAARGIARDTHHVVTLVGEFGTARFNSEGVGYIEWGSGHTAEFDGN